MGYFKSIWNRSSSLKIKKWKKRDFIKSLVLIPLSAKAGILDVFKPPKKSNLPPAFYSRYFRTSKKATGKKSMER